MSASTKIEWCDHSASPWEGCTKVSPGCAHCYAAARDARHLHEPISHWGKGAPRRLVKGFEAKVRAWNRQRTARCPTCRRLVLAGHPCVEHDPVMLGSEMDDAHPTVFPSVCDWLDAEVPVEWLARFLKLIHETPNLTWLLLTKRPELWHNRLGEALKFKTDGTGKDGVFWQWLMEWWGGFAAPANVWVGASIEDQRRAVERVPALLSIPATGRFLSLEPLLGPVDLTHLDADSGGHQDWCQIDSLTGRHTDMGRPCKGVSKLDWLIIGGESGLGARTCEIGWIRSLRDQGLRAGVPVFVKQIGRNPTWEGRDVDERWYEVLAHEKGGEPTEWPHDLRVRQFPESLR